MMHIAHSHPEGAYYYLVFNLAAILVGISGAAIAAHKSNWRFSDFAVIVATGILCMIIGGKLIVFDSGQWMSLLHEGQLATNQGKSVIGAIVGGMIGAWGAARILGIKGSVLDLAAVSFPLALAVQRIGCLLAGCCHGVVTGVPWGITYEAGSRPFIEQQQLGVIPADAITSLPVHPDQLYSILACLVIAFVAWRTGNRFKSSSGKFIFSVMLYLAFRFLEEFTRFRMEPVEWMGLQIIQWKTLVIFTILGAILYFRERKFTSTSISTGTSLKSSGYALRILFISMLVLLVTFLIGGWLSFDERSIVILSVLPLSGIVIFGFFGQILFSRKYIKFSCLFGLAIVLMSQKVDKPQPTPKSYTSFDLQAGSGEYNLDHEFNYGTYPTTDCDGNPYLAVASEDVPYHTSYKIGGIGISRKIYYNQWRSLLASLHIYKGGEKQTQIPSPGILFTAPDFTNNLYSINPMLQYDGRAMGFGIGGSFGLLGHDVQDDPEDHRDYNPKVDVRKASLQARVRIFSERFSFIEILGGYDLGSTGDYNWQFLYGTRFNSNKYMLKTGIAWSNHGGRAVVLSGQIRMSPRFWISPQFMMNYRNNDGLYSRKGHRVGLGIEYRINDRK